MFSPGEQRIVGGIGSGGHLQPAHKESSDRAAQDRDGPSRPRLRVVRPSASADRSVNGSVHSQGVRQDCKQGFEGAGGAAPSPHPGPGREPWRGAGQRPAEQNFDVLAYNW